MHGLILIKILLLFVDYVRLEGEIRHQEKCEDDHRYRDVRQTIIQTDIIETMKSETSHDT